MDTDYAAIESLVKRMYAVFSNRDGRVPNLNELYDLFIPQGLIVKAVGDVPEIFDLAKFIAPREKILTDGTLAEFEEWETGGETTVFGPIAHRVSRYSKKGQLSGVAFESKGIKSMQFLQVDGAWRLSSLSWHDY